MKEFVLEKNAFLDRNIRGFYHAKWYGSKKSKSLRYLEIIKQSPSNRQKQWRIDNASEVLYETLMQDLQHISRRMSNQSLTVCVSPGTKKDSLYGEEPRIFQQIVSSCANKLLDFFDGSSFIQRNKSKFFIFMNTPVNHLINRVRGDYRGEALDNCEFSEEIKGRDILLVNEVYYKIINHDEDMVQALFEKGARSVTFYAVGYSGVTQNTLPAVSIRLVERR